jgi:hypothetical protein
MARNSQRKERVNFLPGIIVRAQEAACKPIHDFGSGGRPE